MPPRPDWRSLPSYGFADPGPLRDELTALALAGTKTGTASLVSEFEADGDPLPAAGDLSALLDSADRPIAVVETTSARVVRLADVDDEHAIAEGEGYANAREFRVAHERYWNSYIDRLAARLGVASLTLSDDTLVVAERLRIVEIVDPDATAGEIRVRPAAAADRAMVDAFLAEHHADVVARLGELVDARRHPALLAEVDGRLEGVLTWIVGGGELEVLTLHVVERRHGTGSALLAAARRVAEAAGCRRLWLVTTNDNTDALRFYQRHGLGLARLDPGAVDRSRSMLKPSIPAIGDHGIPLRDELVLEQEVVPAGRAAPGVTQRVKET